MSESSSTKTFHNSFVQFIVSIQKCGNRLFYKKHDTFNTSKIPKAIEGCVRVVQISIEVRIQLMHYKYDWSSSLHSLMVRCIFSSFKNQVRFIIRPKICDQFSYEQKVRKFELVHISSVHFSFMSFFP